MHVFLHQAGRLILQQWSGIALPLVLLLQAVQMQWSSHSSAREEKKTIAVSALGLCSASVHLLEMASRT